MRSSARSGRLRARRRSGLRALGALLALVLLTHTAAAQPTLVDASLQLETLTSDLARPVAIAFLGAGDALVIERFAGRVRRILGGVLQPAPVLEIAGAADDTETLMGIAINGESPPAVFLYIEDKTGLVGNRVERYTWNPTTEVLESPQLVLQISPAGSATLHDGGYLMLGPPDDPAATAGVGDGQVLYVTVGDLERDGQLQNDPAGAPPDGTSVIFRLLQDGSPAPGNPFAPYCSATTTTVCADDLDCPAGESCLSQVASYYAYGVRNSYGLAIDPHTDALWDTENGDTSHDEVNRVAPGMNSGWIPLMGPGDPGTVTLFDMPGGGDSYVDPLLSWFPFSPGGNTGPTGIVFPYGGALGSAYDGHLLFSDFNPPGQIYAVPLTAGRDAFQWSALPSLADAVADDQAELDQLLFGTGFSDSIVALERGPLGALYVVTYFDGNVYRISSPSTPLPATGRLGRVLLVLALAGAAVGFVTMLRGFPGASGPRIQ